MKMDMVFSKMFIAVFITFIFLVMSFGREFAILHIGPVFVTEILIFFGIFMLLLNTKKIFKLPHTFLVFTKVYFILGCLYLAKGLLDGNLFALRDLVYCVYILFCPLIFAIFSQKKHLKLFLSVVILSNIIGLTIVRLCIYTTFSWAPLHEFFGRIKAFNYLLYFGITLSFMVPLFAVVKEKMYKMAIAVLCAFNLYLLIVWGVRTSWIAIIGLIIFLFLFFDKKKLTQFIIYFIPVFVIVSGISLLFFDSKNVKKEVALGKFASMNTFFKNRIARSHSTAALNAKNNVVSKEASLKPVPIKVLVPKTPAQQSTVKIEPEVPKTPAQQEAVKVEPEAEKTIGPDSIYYEVYQEKKKQTSSIKYVNDLASIIWRLDVWNTSIRYGAESPIFGMGFGVYPIFAKSNRIGVNSRVTPAHNHLISIFYKMGFVGLGLFLFINFYAFIYGLRYFKKCKDEFIACFLLGALGSFVLWHIMALFFDIIDSPPTSIFLWIFIGLIFTVVELDKKLNPQIGQNV